MPPKKRKVQSKLASTKASLSHHRKSRSKYGVQKRRERRLHHWENILKSFQAMTTTLQNQKGRPQTYEEHRMIILAINASLRRAYSLYKKTKVKYLAGA